MEGKKDKEERDKMRCVEGRRRKKSKGEEEGRGTEGRVVDRTRGKGKKARKGRTESERKEGKQRLKGEGKRRKGMVREVRGTEGDEG